MSKKTEGHIKESGKSVKAVVWLKSFHLSGCGSKLTTALGFHSLGGLATDNLRLSDCGQNSEHGGLDTTLHCTLNHHYVCAHKKILH